MLLVVDNLSSFMPYLIHSLNTLAASYDVKKYSDLVVASCSDCVDVGEYDGIILSGRRRNDRSMNVVNMRLVDIAYREDRPLLGICYGAEIIALAMHGTIRRIGKVTGEESVYVHEDSPIANNGMMMVYESHDYSIATLPSVLKSVAYSRSCSNEIIMHICKPIFGTQFHPEASNSHGLDLLRRFVMLAKR